MQPARARLRAAYSAARLMFCERRDANCNRLCTARRSDLASCDGAAGFDDREEFRRMMLMLLEQRGLRTLESGKSSSKLRPCKRRPWD